MITSRSQSYESQLQVDGPGVGDPELEEQLYDTFLKMRSLLEEYAPSSYSDMLRERTEGIRAMY